MEGYTEYVNCTSCRHMRHGSHCSERSMEIKDPKYTVCMWFSATEEHLSEIQRKREELGWPETPDVTIANILLKDAKNNIGECVQIGKVKREEKGVI